MAIRCALAKTKINIAIRIRIIHYKAKFISIKTPTIYGPNAVLTTITMVNKLRIAPNFSVPNNSAKRAVLTVPAIPMVQPDSTKNTKAPNV